MPATQSDRATIFNHWVAYCHGLGHDPVLSNVPFALQLDFLIVFGLRYRRGLISRSAVPVRSKRVAEALRAVGQEFARLGKADPRMDGTRYHYRLGTLFKAWDDEDPAPSRVWPINITILRSLARRLEHHPRPCRAHAILDLCIIGFFFLCRPGEYALSSASEHGRSTPFRLRDVTFSSPTVQRACAAECSSNDVQAGVYITLTYTDQKNATRGEALGHGLSGDDTLCPVRAGQRRVLHLQQHSASPETPLHTYFDPTGAPHQVTTAMLTKELRAAAADVEHITHIPPSRITAYSARSGGATTLLISGVDQTAIRALGRWKSDAIFLYLRTQASTLTARYSHHMLAHGEYTFSPSADVYADRDLLPLQAPRYLSDALQASDSLSCPLPTPT